MHRYYFYYVKVLQKTLCLPPFEMRSVSSYTNNLSRAYRYGFNGMEKDDEVKGAGNSYDFGARMLDTRLGRWLSLDPMLSTYPALSPYHFSMNSPILFKDKEGKTGIVTVQKNPDGGGIITISAVFYVTGRGVSEEEIKKKVAQYNADKGKVFKSYDAGDGYTVNFDVQFIAVSEECELTNPDENLIIITSENVRPHTAFVQHSSQNLETGEINTEMNISNTALVSEKRSKSSVVFHEGIHLLGLSDRYGGKQGRRKIVVGGKTSEISVPHKGWAKEYPYDNDEKYIMGGGKDLNEISPVNITNYVKAFARYNSGKYLLNKPVDVDLSGSYGRTGGELIGGEGSVGKEAQEFEPIKKDESK